MPLADVLAALRTRDEVHVDLGSEGRLVLRRERPAARPDGPAARPPLTERELVVLRLLDRGLAAAVAAEVLDLHLGEVAARLRAARRACGVSSTSAAVRVARDAGLLPPRPPVRGQPPQR